MANIYTYAKEEDILNEKYITIGLDETVPEDALSSICKFKLIPKTQIAVYPLFKDGYFKANGKYFGAEIPLITTEGDIAVYDAKGEIKSSFYVSDIINVNSVSDIVTESYIEKHWSDKFYISKKPAEVVSVGNNAIYIFKFTEDDFANTGIPKKTIGEDLNIASSAFFKISSSAIDTTTAYGASPSYGCFYYDSDNNEWILKVRAQFFAGDIEGELFKVYSKVFMYYELNTPYIINNPHIISLTKGDYISFIPKINDIHSSLIEDKIIWTDGWGTLLTSINITPELQANIPCSISSSLTSFDIIAKGINSSNNSIDVNNYNWIGDGDGSTDYTSLIQNKIDELNMFKGGIVYLGNGTYNITKSLIIYENISIIGTGDTIINQISDKMHGIIISGSNINIEGLTIKLSGNCDGTTEHTLTRIADPEIIGCIYINSDNKKTNSDYDSSYPENMYCQHITIKDVTLQGTYGFKWEGNYQIYPENKNTYKGCGIVGTRMFFNYCFAENIRMKNLYSGFYGSGGANILSIFCTDCKIMVYDTAGGYNNYDIKGHTAYGYTNSTDIISISDMAVYSNGETNNFNVQTYDSQWFEYLIYFDSFSMFNKYNMHYMSGGYHGYGIEQRASSRIKHYVYNIGRGNVNMAPYVNEPFHIGAARFNLTGQSEFKDVDPMLYNVLAGAGIWGNISTNATVSSDSLSLKEICRYPNNYLFSSSVGFNETPSIDNPIEIIIDITNRPIVAFPNIFIQFHHNYVASDFTITWYSLYDNEIKNIAINNNTNVVNFYNLNQAGITNIGKIKISITKALKIDQLEYRAGDYTKYSKNYNENSKVGIVNIGMVGDMFGRSFLGECGGSLYGDLNLENNIITNLGTPIEDTDAVNKHYVDEAVNAGGAVSSVNGQVGEVELKLEDINDNIVADESMFQYKASESASFYFGSSRMSATGSTNGGYSLTANVNGLSISGNPYNDNDIILNQINWVDENDMSQGTVTTTHKLSEKADKTSILITSESSLILTHNQEARLGEIATLTLSMPSTIDDLYWSSFCFASGANATSISYSGEPIIWCGDDCDVDGSFIPESNTKYEVHIKKLGTDIVARVGAY